MSKSWDDYNHFCNSVGAAVRGNTTRFRCPTPECASNSKFNGEARYQPEKDVWWAKCWRCEADSEILKKQFGLWVEPSNRTDVQRWTDKRKQEDWKKHRQAQLRKVEAQEAEALQERRKAARAWLDLSVGVSKHNDGGKYLLRRGIDLDKVGWGVRWLPLNHYPWKIDGATGLILWVLSKPPQSGKQFERQPFALQREGIGKDGYRLDELGHERFRRTLLRYTGKCFVAETPKPTPTIGVVEGQVDALVFAQEFGLTAVASCSIGNFAKLRFPVLADLIICPDPGEKELAAARELAVAHKGRSTIIQTKEDLGEWIQNRNQQKT